METTASERGNQRNTNQPIYVVGSCDHAVPGKKFKIHFNGTDVTQNVLDALEFKKKLKNGEYVIRGKKSRKKKAKTVVEEQHPVHDGEDEEPVVYTAPSNQRILHSSNSNISALGGSDGEIGSDSFETVTLQKADNPAQITSIISDDTMDGIYDDDDEDPAACPITLKRKKPSKTTIGDDPVEQEEEEEEQSSPGPSINATKVSKKKAREAQLSFVVSSGMRSEKLRTYIIYGEITEEIQSPIFTFLIKIVKANWSYQDGTEAYDILSILHVYKPPTISLDVVKIKARMSTYFGVYTQSVQKKKKDLAFTEDDLVDEEKTKAFSDLTNSKSTNAKVNREINQALWNFTHTVGANSYINSDNIKYITDERILRILKNVFEDKVYFKTISVFGMYGTRVLSDELTSLGLLKKGIASENLLCYRTVMECLQSMVWRFHLTRDIVEYVFRKCLKRINDMEEATQNKVRSDTDFILEISDIWHKLKSNGTDFGDTSVKETLKNRWSEDAIDFFKTEHAKANNSGRVYVSESHVGGEILHAITSRATANLEEQVTLLLSRLDDCVAYTTLSDDGNFKTDAYFEEMRSIASKFPTKIIVVTCCNMRKHLLKSVFAPQQPQVIHINELKAVKKDGSFVAIIDRAHKMTLQSLYSILSEKSGTHRMGNGPVLDLLFKRIYLFGNAELIPEGSGQPFRDICASGKVQVRNINYSYNLKKIGGSFSDLDTLSHYIREIGAKKNAVVFANKAQKDSALQSKRNPDSFSRKLGIEDAQFFSLTDVRIDSTGLLRDLVIFVITPNTTRYHISKIFDITRCDVTKPSIVFYSEGNIKFDAVKPSIQRCTSFVSVLQSHWELL